MEWTCYIFTKHRSVYLVNGDNEEDAWKTLAKRQSCSIKNCKKSYTLKDYMRYKDNIKKLTL